MLAKGGTSEEEIRRAYPQVCPRQIRTLLAHARGLPSDVEHRFHLLMHDSNWVFGQFTKAKSKNGKGYGSLPAGLRPTARWFGSCEALPEEASGKGSNGYRVEVTRVQH
jgi:hypothetical protein